MDSLFYGVMNKEKIYIFLINRYQIIHNMTSQLRGAGVRYKRPSSFDFWNVKLDLKLGSGLSRPTRNLNNTFQDLQRFTVFLATA